MTHDHWPPSQKWFDHYCITSGSTYNLSNPRLDLVKWRSHPTFLPQSTPGPTSPHWQRYLSTRVGEQWTPWSRVYFLGYGMCRPCDISCWSRNVPWGAASWKTPGCDRQQIPPWKPSGGIVCIVCLLHFKLCKQSHLMVASFQSDGAGRQTCWRWPPHLWRQPCWGKTCMIFFGEHFYMG